MSETQSIVTILQPTVTTFNKLIEPRAFKRNGKEIGEPKYGSTWVFDLDNPAINQIKETALAVSRAKWPGRDVVSDVRNGKLTLPWKLGDREIAKRNERLVKAGKDPDNKMDFMAGKLILKSSSKFRPRLSILLPNGKVADDLDDRAIQIHKHKFYNGVLALGELNLVAFDATKDGDPDGVTAYLNIFCSTNTGKRLSSGRTAAEAFAGYVGTPSSVDPTIGDPDGLDDDIPF